MSVLLGGLGIGLVDIGLEGETARLVGEITRLVGEITRLVGETARLSNTLSILEADRSEDLGSVLCRVRGEPRIVGRIRRIDGVLFSGLVGDLGPSISVGKRCKINVYNTSIQCQGQFLNQQYH